MIFTKHPNSKGKAGVFSLWFIGFWIFMVSCYQEHGIKLNDVQVIGSHNSYKIAIEKPLWNYLYQRDSVMAKSLQYEHIPIEEQLNLGLRNLELDVFYDSIGGHFTNPKGLDIVRSLGKDVSAFDEEHKLKNFGLKLFHIQDIDFRSHYLLFKDCLKALKSWSNKSKNHTPIIVLINAKDKMIEDLKKPFVFSEEALVSIDREILSIFSYQELITPNFVQGDYKTLEEAILTNGWPNLNSVKGKFLFVLDENEEKINRYLKGHSNKKDVVMFVNTKEGTNNSAFRIINNPIEHFDYIKQLVSKGYMVRTRADEGTNEARLDSYERFEKAKLSGAQVISTDYYLPSKLFKSSYRVSFNGGGFERIK